MANVRVAMVALKGIQLLPHQHLQVIPLFSVCIVTVQQKYWLQCCEHVCILYSHCYHIWLHPDRLASWLPSVNSGFVASTSRNDSWV